jgi:4-hydroxy-4-methyl-2-oxoglutarate aldolase
VIADGTSLERLRRFGTCAIANAIETLNLRLRNEGYTDDAIKSFSAGTTPMVAHAVTVRIRCSSPPTDGRDYLESTQWWNYVVNVPAPRLVVIQDVDPSPGTGALVGEVHANILRALGCIGVATNGTIRDLPALRNMGFHAYARGLSVSHAYSHIVDMAAPVEVAGLKISSGDLLHGDEHGLLSIPPGAEAQIVEAAERLAARERQIIELCQREEFSIEPLRDAIRAFRTSTP